MAPLFHDIALCPGPGVVKRRGQVGAVKLQGYMLHVEGFGAVTGPCFWLEWVESRGTRKYLTMLRSIPEADYTTQNTKSAMLGPLGRPGGKSESHEVQKWQPWQTVPQRGLLHHGSVQEASPWASGPLGEKLT